VRSGIGLLVVAIALGGASAEAGTAALPRPALVPNAVAFRDSVHGVLGSGWENCADPALHCHLRGAISITSDGGETWRVVRRTPRPVIAMTRVGEAYVARLDDGETLESGDGRTWRLPPPSTAGIDTTFSVCPQGMTVGTNAGAEDWSLCTTEPSAGSQGKAVYRDLPDRGWVRVACTGFFNLAPCSGHGRGGIASYGYPLGIAANDRGFGLIWESRGTLYSTSDGGRHWHPHPKVAKPEIDFGLWAFVLPRGGRGFAVLAYGGTRYRRLVVTADAGRTWSVVHRWR
jgi:photosystem II stability/assembly factor-like uncharacterized protein